MMILDLLKLGEKIKNVVYDINMSLKKHFIEKKRIENLLLSDLQELKNKGEFLKSCTEKYFQSQKYKIAKQRYIEILKKSEDYIKVLRKMTEENESKLVHNNKLEQLSFSFTKD